MRPSNRTPFLSVYDEAGKRLVGFACNSGPKGWLPCNRDGEGIGAPLPNVEACIALLRELALHGEQDGD
jgi:hypothetical protein